MIHARIEPWLSWKDYDAFRELAPHDPALLSSFDSWLELANEMVALFSKSGVPVEKVLIDVKEFAAYCNACGLNPDGVARAAFAVQKVRGACQDLKETG